ncbi:MAG: ferrous iron transport protein A [Cyclobacteriaceae bacterium]|nr:ferrous iron transport protein A [Cyclobacteriaceae bacterium]MCB0498788.1 ferrous iron transport protein A [Cyclobacteriaceae bacterium]MCB9237698.1 ferrous iron transport protein A [Flammeovirgaceae bacterium]MCW5903779.1 ferrous iron transport protein A [Cyclobacteriaceae bacterium]
MAPGETAIIAGFVSHELSNKLLEMGFLPGSVIKYNFKAPLGDPICVTISGYDITLRLEEAAMISILN